MSLDAQPIVDLATGVTGRHELLIRLRDGLEPDLGPAEFLPAAERTDLVLRIDRWVVERAVAALATPRARAEGLCFEVNVSARSLDDPDLGGWILDQLKVAEVEPERLGLEITETAAISSLRRRALPRPAARRARAAASPSTTSAPGSPRSPTSRTCRSRRSRSRGSSCGRPTPTPSTAR